MPKVMVSLRSIYLLKPKTLILGKSYSIILFHLSDLNQYAYLP